MIDTVELLIIIGGAILLSLILTTIVVWAINRRLSKQINRLAQAKAGEELQKHRNYHEKMAAERTARLTTVNAQLQQEIVERRQIEATLRESEARYRELFNTMASGVAVYESIDDGQDFIFHEFNRAGQQIEGVRAEDVIGKRVMRFFRGSPRRGFWQRSNGYGTVVNRNMLLKLFTRTNAGEQPSVSIGPINYLVL
jgi:PAS domain-containing protein